MTIEVPRSPWQFMFKHGDAILPTHSVWNLTLAFELTSTFITSNIVPGSASSNVVVVRVPLPGVLIPPLPSALPPTDVEELVCC